MTVPISMGVPFYPQIQPTNNQAERSLRPVVIF
jgi:hypothetical protein